MAQAPFATVVAHIRSSRSIAHSVACGGVRSRERAMTQVTRRSPTHLEREAALLALHQYVRAHETGDAAFIQLAFAKDARIVGHLGGSKISWTVDEYAARFSGRPAADAAQRRRHVELLSVTGVAAVALVTLDYPAVKFADYMALLKLDGQWKIVSKSFHAQPKPDATP